jgi:two-component system sensor histidine kinase DesK
MVIGRVGRWWRGRTQVERFDLYTRWSLYGLAGLGPAMIAWVAIDADPPRPALAAALIAASLAQTGLGIVVIRAAISRRRDTPRDKTPDKARDKTPPVIRPIGAMALATLAGLILAIRQLDTTRVNPWLGIVFFVIPFVGALSMVVPLRHVTLGLLATAAAPVITQAVAPGAVSARAMPELGVVTLITGIASIVGYRCSLWMLDVVWELDRTRDVQARLAVASERPTRCSRCANWPRSCCPMCARWSAATAPRI